MKTTDRNVRNWSQWWWFNFWDNIELFSQSIKDTQILVLLRSGLYSEVVTKEKFCCIIKMNLTITTGVSSYKYSAYFCSISVTRQQGLGSLIIFIAVIYLLWYINRRSRSRGWFVRSQRQRQWGQRSPQSSSGRPSWGCRELGTSQEQIGSGWWWSRLPVSYLSWTAGAGWRQTPGRWRMSTGSEMSKKTPYEARLTKTMQCDAQLTADLSQSCSMGSWPRRMQNSYRTLCAAWVFLINGWPANSLDKKSAHPPLQLLKPPGV